MKLYIIFCKRPVMAGLLAAFFFGVMAGGISIVPRVVYAQNVLTQGNAAAAAEIRFQQLEKEMRRLTGQIEQQQYDIRQLNNQISVLQEALNVKQVQILSSANGTSNVGGVGNGTTNQSGYEHQGVYAKPLPVEENGGISVSSHSSSLQSSSSFENSTVQSLGTYITKPANGQNAGVGGQQNNNLVLESTGNAEGDYNRAYAYIKARNYGSAEQAFGSFIKVYPEHKLASNAQYWYGETFYVRGSYDQAARIFAEGYQKYPQGAKAASNLLKLGMSLVGMGKPDDACIAFKQLKKDYSNSAVPVLKRADVEMEKISCQ